MQDKDLLSRIQDLVAEEQELRQQVQGRELDAAEERRRLEHVEQALDQCWDLLRQRRALRGSGLDPDAATARPISEVEGYIQ